MKKCLQCFKYHTVIHINSAMNCCFLPYRDQDILPITQSLRFVLYDNVIVFIRTMQSPFSYFLVQSKIVACTEILFVSPSSHIIQAWTKILNKYIYRVSKKRWPYLKMLYLLHLWTKLLKIFTGCIKLIPLCSNDVLLSGGAAVSSIML